MTARSGRWLRGAGAAAIVAFAALLLLQVWLFCRDSSGAGWAERHRGPIAAARRLRGEPMSAVLAAFGEPLQTVTPESVRGGAASYPVAGFEGPP